MNTLEIALDLAANRGIPVFPCKPDKTPATPHGFKDATTDLAQIEAWFSDREALIGVPTGTASGLNVLDVAPRVTTGTRSTSRTCSAAASTRRDAATT
jgi:hypothetical protein